MNEGTVAIIFAVVLLLAVTLPGIIYENNQYNDFKDTCEELGYQEVEPGAWKCINTTYDPVTGEEHIIGFKPKI